MAAPKSYLAPGWGYIDETNSSSFFIPGLGYINQQKFFSVSLALTQPDASTALTLREKFVGSLVATQPANTAQLSGTASQAIYPGRVSIGDAAQGGLLALADSAVSGLALTDTELYHVQISESVQ